MSLYNDEEYKKIISGNQWDFSLSYYRQRYSDLQSGALTKIFRANGWIDVDEDIRIQEMRSARARLQETILEFLFPKDAILNLADAEKRKVLDLVKIAADEMLDTKIARKNPAYSRLMEESNKKILQELRENIISISEKRDEKKASIATHTST